MNKIMTSWNHFVRWFGKATRGDLLWLIIGLFVGRAIGDLFFFLISKI